MIKYLNILWAAFWGCLLLSCKGNSTDVDVDPVGTIYYVNDSLTNFSNPERGWYRQVELWSSDMTKSVSEETMRQQRENKGLTLYLFMYYLPDFVDKDFSPECLSWMGDALQNLRASGAKAFVRYAYSNGYAPADKPWDATPEQVSRHIEQLRPLWQQYSDVICAVQAGFVGSWGEWYYTENFNMDAHSQQMFALRKQLLDHLLQAVPDDRQICLRTPEYKILYLNTTYDDPLTETEAHTGTAKSRLGGHNDCFLSGSNDVGTYDSNASKEYWKTESKYIFMGGESCALIEQLAEDKRALKEMEDLHISYLHNSYYGPLLAKWRKSGLEEVLNRRLGYRIVLDNALFTAQPKANQLFTVDINLHNEGFASVQNRRAVELIFVQGEQRFVYEQNDDPREWYAGETKMIKLHCILDAKMSGTYTVYLNLPDPYATIHDDPAFSIRLANQDMWEPKTGYNKLGTIEVLPK